MEGDLGVAPAELLDVISIHALRVEGDCRRYTLYVLTPSISIHALRVEGDTIMPVAKNIEQISIHALRVEGDACNGICLRVALAFLSTPSGWRAT